MGDAVRAAHKADIPSPTKALEKANKLRVKWSRKKVGDRNKLKLTTAALKKSRASRKRVDAGVRADQTAAVKTVKLARSKAEQDVIKGRSAKKVKKVTTNTNESEVKSVMRAKTAVKKIKKKLKYARSEKYRKTFAKAKGKMKKDSKVLVGEHKQTLHDRKNHRTARGIANRAEAIVKKAEQDRARYRAKVRAKERGLKAEKKRKREAKLAKVAREKKAKVKLNEKNAKAAMRKAKEKAVKKKINTQNNKAAAEAAQKSAKARETDSKATLGKMDALATKAKTHIKLALDMEKGAEKKKAV